MKDFNADDVHPFVIGITGSIGVGKSFVANYLAQRFNAKLLDADKMAHEILNDKVEIIKASFPDVVYDSKVNRKKLADIVFSDYNKLLELEKIIHPELEQRFLSELELIKKSGYRFVIFDAPLLFEANMEKYCDSIITITCPKFLQYIRVIKRGKLNLKQLRLILQRQLDIKIKTAKSNYIIVSAFGEWYISNQINKIIEDMNVRTGNLS